MADDPAFEPLLPLNKMAALNLPCIGQSWFCKQVRNSCQDEGTTFSKRCIPVYRYFLECGYYTTAIGLHMCYDPNNIHLCDGEPPQQLMLGVGRLWGSALPMKEATNLPHCLAVRCE